MFRNGVQGRVHLMVGAGWAGLKSVWERQAGTLGHYCPQVEFLQRSLSSALKAFQLIESRTPRFCRIIFLKVN